MMSLKNSNMGRSIAILKVCVLTCTTGTSDEATEFQAVALLLLVLPLVVGQAEDSVEGPVCSQRVLQLREVRANSNLTISVKTCVCVCGFFLTSINQLCRNRRSFPWEACSWWSLPWPSAPVSSLSPSENSQ